MNWPPMTMRFTITPQTQLNNVKDGEAWTSPSFSRAICRCYRISAPNNGPATVGPSTTEWTTHKNTALILGSMLIGGALTAALYARWAPTHSAAPAAEQQRKVLFWYDPMYPNTRFDKPGKSPFMDMDLVPKYADEEHAAAGAPGCVSTRRRPRILG